MTQFDCGQAIAIISLFVFFELLLYTRKQLQIRVWDCLGRFHHRDESGDLAELDVDHLVQNAVNIVDAGPIQQDFSAPASDVFPAQIRWLRSISGYMPIVMADSFQTCFPNAPAA